MSEQQEQAKRGMKRRRISLSMQDMEIFFGVSNGNMSTSKINTLDELEANYHLQTKLDSYNGPNPFSKTKTLTYYEKFKLAFFTLTGLLFIKIILLIIVIIFAYLFSIFLNTTDNNNNSQVDSETDSQTGRTSKSTASATTSTAASGNGNGSTNASSQNSGHGHGGGRHEFKSYKWWQYPFYYLVLLCIRMVLFIYGFYWLPVTNENKKNKLSDSSYKTYKKIKMVVANHVSNWDGALMVYLFNAAPCAKKEIKSAPLLGKICEGLGTIWIDRTSTAGRRAAINQLKKLSVIDNDNDNECNCDCLPWRKNQTHSTPGGKIVIFPAGTCCNTETMIQFKNGAFLGGNPVLPVALNYKQNCFFDPSALDLIPNFSYLQGLVQFINFVKIDVLEVYVPGDKVKEEIKDNGEVDYQLVKQNVRAKIADKLGVPMTEHTFDDLMLGIMAIKTIGVENAYDFLNYLCLNDVMLNLKIHSKAVLKVAKWYLVHCGAYYAKQVENENDNDNDNDNVNNTNENANENESGDAGTKNKNETKDRDNDGVNVRQQQSTDYSEMKEEEKADDGGDGVVNISTPQLTIEFETFCDIFGLKTVSDIDFSTETEKEKKERKDGKGKSAFARKMFTLLCNTQNRQQGTEITNANKQEVMTFDNFLICIAICFTPTLRSDAYLLFFQCFDRHCRGFINRFDIIRTIKWIERGMFNFI